MTQYRRHRKDGNHAFIDRALQYYGWETHDNSQGQSKGGPDIWAAHRGSHRTVACEVKMPGEPLRKTQQDWFDKWPGEKAILTSIEDVARLTADGGK